MLEMMRTTANSIFSKFLLALIVVSFVIWGIGDIFKSKSNNVIAKIGSKSKITYIDFIEAKKFEINKISSMIGSRLTEQQIRAFNIDQMVLSRLINSKLLELEANTNDIQIGDNTIVHHIKTSTIFQDDSGKFDKRKFTNLLTSSGLTEQTYADSLKKELAAKFLIDNISSEKIYLGLYAPYLYSYNSEKRVIDVINIDPNKFEISTKISQDELQSFYEKNKKLYTAPEYRNITFLEYDLNTTRSKISVSEPELKKEYEDNIADYQQPESRTIYNFVFPTKEQALETLAKLKDGKNLSKVITATLNKPLESFLIKDLKESELPDDLRDIVFSLKPKSYSDVVETTLGFHVIRLEDVTASNVPKFEEIADKIKESLIRKKSEEALFQLNKRIEDELASGSTLEELASKMGITLKAINNIDHKGLDPKGKANHTIPSYNNFLSTAFSQNIGDDNLIVAMPDNNGFFVVRVDKITPPTVKSFEQSNLDVIIDYRKSRQHQLAEKTAEAIVERFKTTKSIDQLTSLYPQIEIKREEISRPENVVYGKTNQILPQKMIEEIFNFDINSITRPTNNTEGIYQLAILRDITFGNQHINNAAISNLAAELNEEGKNYLLEEYMLYLRKKHHVDIIDTKLISEALE